MSRELVQLLNPTDEQLAEANAKLAASGKVQAAVNSYVEQYQLEPYDPAEFLHKVERILKSRIGCEMMGIDRQRLRSIAARAVDDGQTRTRGSGRPRCPESILGAASELAQRISDTEGKPLTVEGAYAGASARLRYDFDIDVSPSAIKSFRSRIKAKK